MAIWEQEPIPEYRQFMEKFPELSDKFGAVISDIMERPRLDKKTKELVIISLLGAQKFESGFKFHVKEAMNKGATKEEIIEVLLLLLIYCEVSSFLNALWWARDLGIV
ncbi:carboxymuconolactone decarboxylase family protein [Desulfobacterota bacterium AH_259_B03_O07]|nr:carboxymuconolactone decarboxylase family protein [Desulfobacterota bacterium AH_259_B03_O07]